MPKHKQKQLLQPKKQAKKKRPEEPETANEFLQAGVDFEEAGEKWRAGDAAKSLRFFTKAIDTYETGLQNFLDSFDLAYNKARLQYEIAQQPRLLVHLSTSTSDLLKTALESHRYAVRIDQDNADLLFNVAQVLTSLAETISENGKATAEDRKQALGLLQESLEFFQRCLNIQEFQLNQVEEAKSSESQEQHAETGATETDTQMDVDGDQASPERDEEAWATIVEPVTVDSLLDTTIAQVETLTTICAVEFSQADWPLAWVEEYFQDSLQTKLITFSSSTSRQHESDLAVAKLRSALSQAAFHNNRIDPGTFASEIHDAYESIDLSKDPHGLVDKADAQLSLATSVLQKQRQDSLPGDSPDDFNKFTWNHATSALDSLSDAAKLGSVPNLPRIHLRRGDCEVLRYSLGEKPTEYPLAIKSTSTLLGNAALYYRMAGRQAGSEGVLAKEEGEEAYVKGIVVSILEGKEEEPAGGLSEGSKADVKDMVEEMKDEGLLGNESVEKIVTMIG